MKHELIGKQFKTNEGYTIEVVNYENKNRVTVKFSCNPDYTIVSTTQNIKNGQIKYPYHKSIYNRGYYGVGPYKARINNIKTKAYVTWFSMMTRCYNPTYHKRQPTYIDCEVCEEWLNFQNYAKWFEENYYESDYKLELDKDLFSSSKVYSPDTCCFLPKKLNCRLKNYKNNPIKLIESYNEFKHDLPERIVDQLKLLCEQEVINYELS